jgi:hypothetical protein
MSPREVKRFAYELAIKFNINKPQTWIEKRDGWTRVVAVIFREES